MANPPCTETPFLVIMMKRDDDALYLHGAKERREGFRARTERGGSGVYGQPTVNGHAFPSYDDEDR